MFDEISNTTVLAGTAINKLSNMTLIFGEQHQILMLFVILILIFFMIFN